MSEAALRGIGHPRAGALRLASDARLVRIAVRGERRAFAAIFQRYHQELYRYCGAILGDDEEAGDALQNTMLKVMRALPGESRQIALRPWLYRIAHNEAIAILRQRPPTAELGEQAATPASMPERRAEVRERLRRLVNDLRALPDRQRGALVMRELNEMDYAAIGAVFETSAAAARQTVYEARVALQEMTEGREMSCEEVRKALSAGDGRVLRGRKLRAHLRGCQGCRDFRSGIRQRKAALAALAPPLPALAAAGLLQGILGSGHAGGAGGGLLGSLAGTSKVLAGSTGVKSAAAVAAATVAVGAGELTGVVNAPVINGSGSPPATKSTPGADRGQPVGPQTGEAEGDTAGATPTRAGTQNARGKGKASRGHSRSTGKSAAAPGKSVAHPQGPPSGQGGHSGFGKSHAPAVPPAAQGQPPVGGAKPKPSQPGSQGSKSATGPPPQASASQGGSSVPVGPETPHGP